MNEITSEPMKVQDTATEENSDRDDNNDREDCIYTSCDHCWTDEVEFEYYEPIFCRLAQKNSTLEYNMGGYSGFTIITENFVWTGNKQQCDTLTIGNFGNEEYMPNNGSYTIFNDQGYIDE